ncbi:MAG: hypothetical protein ACRDHE_12440, partial [Ktedonobacterales bacterium]
MTEARSTTQRVWWYLRTRRGQLTLAWALVLLLMAIQAEQVGLHMLQRYATYHADAFDLGN